MIHRLLLACLLSLPLLANAQSNATVASAASSSAPRLGIDYEILPTAMPTYGQGGIEVAEVFGYVCIHCAHFQPYVDVWKKKLPADVRFEYVPAAFGNPWDNFARAFYAAQMLGVQEKTHDAVFNAIFVDHSLAANASLEQIADAYGKFGVDRDKFFSTMRGYEVSAKLNTARQFAIAGAVDGTPTIIVAGKYRLKETTDRGAEGMLATVDFLIARERRKAGR